METVLERITANYVDNMSLESLRQFVYEDLVHLCEHGDKEIISANFFDLTDEQQAEIRKDFPEFNPN